MRTYTFAIYADGGPDVPMRYLRYQTAQGRNRREAEESLVLAPGERAVWWGS